MEGLPFDVRSIVFGDEVVEINYILPTETPPTTKYMMLRQIFIPVEDVSDSLEDVKDSICDAILRTLSPSGPDRLVGSLNPELEAR